MTQNLDKYDIPQRLDITKAQFSLEIRYGLKTVGLLFRMIGKF